MSQSHNPGHNPTGRKTPSNWVRQHKAIAYRLFDSAPHDRAFEWPDTDLSESEWRRYHCTAKHYGAIKVATPVTSRPAEIERNEWSLSEGFVNAVKDRRNQTRDGWCSAEDCSERAISNEAGDPVCGVCGAPIRGDVA